MIDYLYDGTFDGLLTCIYHNYYTEKAAGVYMKNEYQPSLLHGYMDVETDEEKATIVYDAISTKISDYALRLMYRGFLSSDCNKGTILMNYAVAGFKAGYSIGSLHSYPAVLELENIARKVGVEQERMLQFVRFSAMETRENYSGSDGNRQVLYAEVEPDNDVLELVAHHFADRFKGEPFIIRDTGRNKAIVAYGGHWYVTEMSSALMPDGTDLAVSADEEQFRSLWRTYFDHIAIKERTNSRCQRNHMPVRYWKNLTEVNDTGRT